MNTSIRDTALGALRAVDPVKYAAERNYLGKSTRLSVYITRGVLTLPEIRDHLSAHFTASQNHKLVFELAWREYWQREWLMRGEDIFKDLKHAQAMVESEDISSVILTANTGIDAIDTGIVQLYETGYIHNHMRMWLSGLICNIAHTKWQKPAHWMYYHLLDGDPASNMLSWQWISGTFSSKRYLPAQENINRYTDTEQRGTFLDQSYEALEIMPTPKVLQMREEVNLSWAAPASDKLAIESSKPTLLYHSFWLNGEWHKDLDANQILVLEPRWFARFPVSEKVTCSILDIAREIPGLQVYVGDIEDLTPRLGKDIKYMSHPSVKHWPGKREDIELLFPDVPMKSFNSFMSFWKQCEKHL